MTKIAWMASAAAFALTAGCASPPSLPTDFHPRAAAIVAADASPAVVLDGPGSKGSAAAKGAATWGGVGFVVGGMLCAGTGILIPLCLGTMVPAGLGVGAVGGAVTGAIRAEGEQESLAKRAMLEAELAAWGTRLPLASQVQTQTRPAGALPTSVGAATADATAPAWTLKIGLTELATVGSGSGAPFALKASATIDLQRAGQAQAQAQSPPLSQSQSQTQPPFVKVYQASTATRMTTADWAAGDGLAIRAALDLLTQDLVNQMVNDLASAKARP